MSRIGKKLIILPEGIELLIEKTFLSVSGKNGKLEKTFLEIIAFERDQNNLFVTRANDSKFAKSYHGLTRALVDNMIKGVHQKFKKVLLAEGVGYKFQINKNILLLNMGFTHNVEFLIPDGIDLKLESPIKLAIEGIDKEKVGLFASQVRSIRPPEPYKGKGIMYEGEKIIRKAGKTGE